MIEDAGGKWTSPVVSSTFKLIFQHYCNSMLLVLETTGYSRHCA
jgi:hypothetical protein